MTGRWVTVMATTLPRAGFLRRGVALWLDLLIGGLIAMVVLALPVGLLFPLNNGAVQYGSSSLVSGSLQVETGTRFEFGFPGIMVTTCDKVPLDQLPQGLELPPEKLSAAVECRSSALGLLTSARTLRLTAVGQDNGVDSEISATSRVGADGKVRNALTLDDLTYLVFLVYLVVVPMAEKRYARHERGSHTRRRAVEGRPRGCAASGSRNSRRRTIRWLPDVCVSR